VTATPESNAQTKGFGPGRRAVGTHTEPEKENQKAKSKKGGAESFQAWEGHSASSEGPRPGHGNGERGNPRVARHHGLGVKGTAGDSEGPVWGRTLNIKKERLGQSLVSINPIARCVGN